MLRPPTRTLCLVTTVRSAGTGCSSAFLSLSPWSACSWEVSFGAWSAACKGAMPSASVMARASEARGSWRMASRLPAGSVVRGGVVVARKVALELSQRIGIEIDHVARRVVQKVQVAAQRRLQVHVREVVLGDEERRGEVVIAIDRQHLQVRVRAHRMRQVASHVRGLQRFFDAGGLVLPVPVLA